MKKISLFTKIIFNISNIILIIIYLFPGSILGWIFYGNIQKQPQISTDFILFSSNHLYAFVILSFLGLFSYIKSFRNLFFYLFFISVFLELCHLIIPQRSFEFEDLFGNFLGVLIVFSIFNFYKFFKRINE